jgi:hypothetical protein
MHVIDALEGKGVLSEYFIQPPVIIDFWERLWVSIKGTDWWIKSYSSSGSKCWLLSFRGSAFTDW